MIALFSVGYLSEDKTLLKLELRQDERLSEREIGLIEMLKSVKKSCGQVCDTTLKGKYQETDNLPIR